MPPAIHHLYPLLIKIFSQSMDYNLWTEREGLELEKEDCDIVDEETESSCGWLAALW